MEKKLSLKTMDGCKRILAICLILVFLGAFFARLIDSDFGNVKIEQYKIDARGATLDGEMFYPAGTNSTDSLPCIISLHGTGCTYGVVRHFCIEAARRGYVALAVSCYAGGISEQPLYDELGHGEDIGFAFLQPDKFNYGSTTIGLWDVVDYVRTLSFVDKTRIGLSGHSMGAGCTMNTVVVDCGYFTYNDLLINVLFEEFGETFTEEEIYQDAVALAESRLSAEELLYFNYLAAEKKEFYDTRVKSAFAMGATFEGVPSALVNVGGHEVRRNVQCNVGELYGDFDAFSVMSANTEGIKTAFYTGDDIQIRKWYVIDDENSSSTVLGDFSELSIANNDELAKAIDNRDVRLAFTNPETHSRNFFSSKTTRDFIDYFAQTLDYNCGNLTEGSVGIPATNQVWLIARMGNFIAMLAVLAMLFPLLKMLLSLKFYQPVIGINPIPDGKKTNKKLYWVFLVLGVVATFFACKYAQGNADIPNDSYFQLTVLAGGTMIYIIAIGLLSLLLLLVKAFINKKQNGDYGLESLNLNLSFSGVLRSFILAFVLVGAVYTSLMMIEYLFKEDFRLWMFILSEMKVDYWFIAAKYAVIFVVPYLAVSACINYNIRTDIPEWKEDLIAVAMGSVGIWLLCLINYLVASSTGMEYSSFIVTYQFNLWVPVTLYILRKSYRETKSLWVGAVLCSVLIAWSAASEVGCHTTYIGQNWLSVFFNV